MVNHWFALSLALAAGCTFPDFELRETAVLETCRDKIRGVVEADVDCGGTCAERCAIGQSCAAPSDCASSQCEAGVCVASSTAGGDAAPGTCSDRIHNQSESDVDCGGDDGCRPCATGQRCDGMLDCNTARCTAGRCQPQTCGDGLLNQDEGDVDCGGPCNPCKTGQHCLKSSDCAAAECSQGYCQSEGCSDGLKNGDESGVDCGGSCSPCADFAGCRADADCRSGVCNVLPQDQGTCLAPTCDDGVLNGAEPSIDCGAACPQRCELTQACGKNADCASAECDEGKCVPAGPTGASLPTVGWSATASNTFAQSVPGKALDGNDKTMWESGGTQQPGMWFAVDMQASRVFYGLDVICTSNNDQFRQARVLISDDGANFTAISAPVAGENWYHFNFGAARVARYIKVELTQASQTWWRIDELRVTQ